MLASATTPRNKGGVGSSSFDTSLADINLVDQLHSDTWCEGIVVRPSGQILATRVDDAPEIYNIDLPTLDSASDGSTTPDRDAVRVIHTFSDATGAFNICRLTGTAKEEYAVVSGVLDIANVDFHSNIVWRLSFESDSADPVLSKLAELPEALFCLGMETISNDVLAVADSSKSRIWRVHVPTGRVSVLFDEPSTMRPKSEAEVFGINRVRVVDGYLWHTNHSNGTLYRAPVKYIDGGRDIEVTGPSRVLATGLDQPDGLVVKRDGSAAYISSYVHGNLWRIDVAAGSNSGTVTTVLHDLVTPTTMDLVYHEGSDKPTLFVMCCGAVNPVRITGARGKWLELADVDSNKMNVLVTITTEVTYSSVDDETDGTEGTRFWIST
jgi:hypothetical protein